MIKDFKDISSENPTGQIWKLLRFFLDVPLVSEEIRRIHSIPKEKFKSDVKKQAKQIGYCIRQAEEYFHASSQVDLPTRPTLLYYGVVSLSRALVLLRLDGKHSFDALRKSDKHNHHGLELARGLAEKASASKEPSAFFNSLQCNCHTKNGIPWGHFALFYRSLVPCAFHIHSEIHDHGKSTFISRDTPQPCADLLPLDSLISKRLNVLQLIKTLPDMYSTLIESGIRPDLCRGNVKHKVIQYYKNNEHGNKKVDKIEETHHFFLDGITPGQKDHFLAFYKEHIPNIKLQADFGLNIHLTLIREYSPPKGADLAYYPDIAEDINDRKFYILRPEDYLPETATHLIILFCLGMLSRYYPDLWMRTIDENVRISEITDSLLNLIYRKFPNLLLDQMTWVKHYVHL